MPIQGFINNFTTTLNGAINNSVTSIVVTSATGISAELALSDFINLTIDDGTNVEIVKVTGVATNTLTVVRAQEGTTANAFADTTTIECRATRGSFKNVDIWQPVKLITVPSAQATIEFTGLTDGDYRVDFSHVGSSATESFCFVQGTGATPTYQTATYYYSGLNMTYTAADAGNRASNAAQVVIMPSVDLAASNFLQGYFEIGDIGNAATKKTFNYMAAQSNNARWTAGGGARDVAEVVTALKFFFLTGATFDTGSRFLLSKRNH